MSSFRVSSLFASILLAFGANAAPVLWIDDAAGVLGKVDVATGAVTVVGNTGIILTDIAFDPTGNLYGISFNSLYSVNKNTAATILIGNFGPSLNSLVFNSSGTLFGANSSLYTINTTTGAATLVGNGGAAYSSSGDLAFVGGNLFLSSTVPTADSLVRINTATGAGTVVGSIGVGSVFGLATSDNIGLYGVSGTSVYGINTGTGAGSFLVNYAGHGLGSANGTAFISEAGASVPEPEPIALLGLGFAAIAYASRRRKQ